MHHARDHLQALGYSHMSVCVRQLESKNRSRHPVLGQVVNLDLLLYKILFASCGFVLILYFYSEKGGFNSSFDHLYWLGTASQVTLHKLYQHANCSKGKVLFKLATDSMQFYVLTK